MSNINDGHKDIKPTTETNTTDFVTQLRQTVNNTDSFLNSISSQWEKEHPELSKQWQEFLKNCQMNDNKQQ